MYHGSDAMYSVYPGQGNTNSGVGNSQYPMYNNTPNSANNGVYGNVPGMHGGPMMYVYGNGNGNGGGAGHSNPSTAGGYGMRVDPAVAASFEYNGINNLGGGRGRGGRGGGGGGGYNNAGPHHNQPRRGGSGFYRGGGGGGSSNYFDQQGPSDYEVHDNQLKAPVAVTMETVLPTIGSNRLFSRPPKAIVYGSRSVVRICDAFQEGRCLAGEKCHDIHVRPEYLADTRMQMSSWLMDRENEFRQTLEMDPAKNFRIFVADLKEVVEVPVASLVFTKGLYVDPTTRAKRSRGAGNHAHAHAHAVMQVPTSCGLYSSDPAQCKWGRWCNQVHIDHQWMQSKKEEFDHWFSELQNRYFNLTPDDNFTVHDPQLKTSISLPKFSIAGFSRGLFQGSMKKLASVCLLYQRAKCTAGSCCNQIHVVPQYLSLAREYTTLEQSPDAPLEEKQRVMREMEAMRAPCVELQLREQCEAEPATAGLPSVPLMQPNDAPQSGEASSGTVNGGAGGTGPLEDELDSNGALFEHVQVDEDAEPASHSVSANTSLTRRLNTSAPDISLSAARQIHQDGSYSFNPYGSVASLPDASNSYGRAPVGGRCGTGMTAESAGSGVQYTPGSVHLHQTGSKGSRRLVAVISPETSSSMNEMHRMDEMGASGTVEGGGAPATMVDRHAYPAPALLRAAGSAGGGGAGSAYRAAMHHQHHRGSGGDGDYPYDSASGQDQSSSLHPLDFDASLHFSPSPLLNFDASNTSLYRNASTREEETATTLHLRLAASNTSAPYAGNSTNSHPYMTTSSQQSGAFNTSKNRFSASGVGAPSQMRPRPSSQQQMVSGQAGDFVNPPFTYASVSGSAHSSPSGRPAAVGEDNSGR